MNTQRGFTLLETMIVVTIVGTLASLSIPAYQEYIARGQVAEAVQLASAARAVATEHYALNGQWPEELPEGAAIESARYTAAIALVTEEGSPAATVTATLKEVGVQHDVQGKAIRFTTPDGGATWACQAVDIDERFLPQACRSSAT